MSCLAIWRAEDALRARTATVRNILMEGDGMVYSWEVRRDAGDGVFVDGKLRFLPQLPRFVPRCHEC